MFFQHSRFLIIFLSRFCIEKLINTNSAAEGIRYRSADVIGNEESRAEYDKKLDGFNARKPQEGAGFRGNNTEEKTKTKAKSSSSKSPYENLQDCFEGFFGFKPNSSKVDKNKMGNKSKNPIDTSAMFESFFGKK